MLSTIRLLNAQIPLRPIWMKHNVKEGMFKVTPTASTHHLQDLLQLVKKVRSPTLDDVDVVNMSIFTSLDPAVTALPVSTKMQELARNNYYDNSEDNPWYLKLRSKTIHFRIMDDDNQFKDEFGTIELRSDKALKEFYQTSYVQAVGLVKVSDTAGKVLTTFAELEDGEYYKPFTNYGGSVLKVRQWQNNESKAMEDEILLSLKEFLHRKLRCKPTDLIELPRTLTDAAKNSKQEWDGVLFSPKKRTLYVAEAKHSVTKSDISKLESKLKDLPAVLQDSLQEEYDRRIDKIVGVICGTYFPHDLRQFAQESGQIVCYPSGKRYMVVDDKKLLTCDFKMESIQN